MEKTGSGDSLVVEESHNNTNAQSTSNERGDDIKPRDTKEEDKRTNLIVNYLPPNMTQDEVKALFSNVGDVDSCKLIRDKYTGDSLGYSFVNYVNPKCAAKAVALLNGLRLENKMIKVSYARPSSDDIKGANLYVCGIPKKMTTPEFENMFKHCGKVISARILYDNVTGISRGVAFIRFDKKSEAEKAIAQFHGYHCDANEEPLVVKFANAPTVASTTMQMNDVDMNSANLLNNFNLGLPISSQLAQKYSMLMNNSNFYGDVRSKSTSMPAGWSVFVYNLAPNTVEENLWKLFGPFGAVQNVRIIRDAKTNKCRGFGFVTMNNYEDAMMAQSSLNSIPFMGKIIHVSAKMEPVFDYQAPYGANGMGSPGASGLGMGKNRRDYLMGFEQALLNDLPYE